MDDLDGIYASILAAPADDTPRLVYADCLADREVSIDCPARCRSGQQYGMKQCRDGIMRNAWYDCPTCAGTGAVSNGAAARSEFVRVQCELARLPDECDVWCDDHPRRSAFAPQVGVCSLHHHRRELRERERELFDAHKCAWFGDRWAVLLLPDDEPDVLPGLTEAVVRRGWPDELRTTAAALCGGPCERCEGRGGDPLVARGGLNTGPLIYVAGRDRRNCPACHGTGRTPGLAPALGGWPLGRVVIVGAEPFAATEGTFHWTWTNEHTTGWASNLPDDLIRCGLISRAGIARSFRTRDDAMDALSRAALALIAAARPAPAA